mmetsp:Transcript_194/g.524  ORF Transcript_194/g.524 Transcript_194/m.524 type:complete len:222 (+) Transcript_194:599-1264(+)
MGIWCGWTVQLLPQAIICEAPPAALPGRTRTVVRGSAPPARAAADIAGIAMASCCKWPRGVAPPEAPPCGAGPLLDDHGAGAVGGGGMASRSASAPRGCLASLVAGGGGGALDGHGGGAVVGGGKGSRHGPAPRGGCPAAAVSGGGGGEAGGGGWPWAARVFMYCSNHSVLMGFSARPRTSRLCRAEIMLVARSGFWSSMNAYLPPWCIRIFLTALPKCGW